MSAPSNLRMLVILTLAAVRGRYHTMPCTITLTELERLSREGTFWGQTNVRNDTVSLTMSAIVVYQSILVML